MGQLPKTSTPPALGYLLVGGLDIRRLYLLHFVVEYSVRQSQWGQKGAMTAHTSCGVTWFLRVEYLNTFSQIYRVRCKDISKTVFFEVKLQATTSLQLGNKPSPLAPATFCSHVKRLRMRSRSNRNSKVSGKVETSGTSNRSAGKSWSLEELESQKGPIPLPRRKTFKLWPDVGK